jgi:hypothetical protein
LELAYFSYHISTINALSLQNAKNFKLLSRSGKEATTIILARQIVLGDRIWYISYNPLRGDNRVWNIQNLARIL